MQNNKFTFKETDSMASEFLSYINPNNTFPLTKANWKRAEKVYNTKIFYVEENSALLSKMFFDKKDDKLKKITNTDADACIFINIYFDQKEQTYELARQFAEIIAANEIKRTIFTNENTVINTNIFKRDFANTFAGCVLMPINELTKYLTPAQIINNDINQKEIKDLAAYFGVTEYVLNARLETIRYNYDLVSEQER